MAKNTKIAWTRHTHNPWWGCSSPAGDGCLHCYARTLDRRAGGNYFGQGVPPRLTSETNRREPYKWDRRAAKEGIRPTVFCGSMCDVADRAIPHEWRDELWQTIRGTPHLDWLLLTKRPAMLRRILPPDWGDGYPNVALGVTVENRRQGLRRLEQLRTIPAKLRFLSMEPLLEDLGDLDLAGTIGWVIVGGESSAGARPMDLAWARQILVQCRAQGVPFFFKQVGGRGRDKGGHLLDGQVIRERPARGIASWMPLEGADQP